MANQYFYKVSDIAAPVGDLTISNNLRVGGTTIAGPINKTLNIPVAIAPPDATNLIKILPEQSGTTFILTQSSVGVNDQVLVLPPAAIGLNYTFIVQNATSGSLISIMPYGYTNAGGNPVTIAGTDTNGVAEAYKGGIQAITKVGDPQANYHTGIKSEQVNTAVGNGVAAQAQSAGGIMFTTGVGAAASLRLICVSTSTTGTVKTACRWIGTGQTAAAAKINITA